MSNDDKPSTLREVAERASSKLGTTVRRDLEEKAERRGRKISRQTWNDLLNGKYNRKPGDDLLRNLAALSGVPLNDVRSAAGVPMPGSPFADDLPEDADYIQGNARKILIDAIRLFAQQGRRTAELEAQLKEVGSDDRSAPNTKPGASPGNVTHLQTKAARKGTRQRAVTDRPQNEAGEENQANEGDWEPK